MSASPPSLKAPPSPAASAGRFIPFDVTAGATYALGLTYADHVRETGEKPGQPVVFQKRCLPRPGGRIMVPTAHALHDLLQSLDPDLTAWLCQRFDTIPALLDYEAEIGVILFSSVTEADLAAGAALPSLGFFLANDLTARSIQIAGEGSANRLDFWAAAKSLPGFLPVSSRIWCPDDASPETMPQVILQTHVNGELRQSASTGSVLYTLRQMVQLAAAAAPGGCLQAHDMVLTGTPAGIALSVPLWKRRLARLLTRRQRIRAAVGSAAVSPRFLQAGDTVRISADWLGSFECRLQVPPKKARKVLP